MDGHSRAAVEAAQALGRAGVEVAVSCQLPDAVAFHSRYANLKLEQPSVLASAEFVKWLRELNSRYQFGLVIPSTETSLQGFLDLADDDPLRQLAVLPSAHSLRVCLNKNLTREHASRLEIPIPATRCIHTLADIGDAPSFPVVLKPVLSKLADDGELKTLAPAIVCDEGAWRSLLEDWVPRVDVLQQEYVPGWGVGVELLYRNGKLRWSFAHERLHEWPITGGASTYRRAIDPPVGMLEASRRLLDSLDWNGVAMVEFKRRRDGSFVLLEVNPRLWGSLALSIYAGVNFPLGLWKIARTHPLPPQPISRNGFRARHLSSDLRWLKVNLLADRKNPLLLTRPRLKSLLELGLPLLGRERWDHFYWKDPGPVVHDFRELCRASMGAVWRRARVCSLLMKRRQLVRRAVTHLTSCGAVNQRSLLFVCQANICRSPFAALVASTRLPGFRIESGGFDDRPGRHTPRNVAGEAAALGFDMTHSSSKPLTPDHVRKADLILVMDLMNLDQLAARFPGFSKRTYLLGLFADRPIVEIEDPNHKDMISTRHIMRQIVSAIDRFSAAITSMLRQNAEDRTAP
jgi:protein-tyrosine-phosphatase/predicted ATP-grasp superfamily ATP-dependent carboligase